MLLWPQDGGQLHDVTHPPRSATHCSPLVVMPPFPPLPLQNPPRSSALLLHHIANLSPLLPLPPLPCGFSASYPGHPTFHLCPLSTSLPTQPGLPLCGLTNTCPLHAQTTADPSPGTPPLSCQYTDPGSTNQSRLPANANSCSAPSHLSRLHSLLLLTMGLALPIWEWASWLWRHVFYFSIVSHASNQNT